MKAGFSGVHPDNMKGAAADSKIERYTVKEGEELYLVLAQHIGAPAIPIVTKGQVVKKGELIAESSAFLSANMHSSVNGTVKDIGDVSYPGSGKAKAITITAAAQEDDSYQHVAGETVADIAKSAGIVGMGGAMFPAHVKLSPPSQLNTLVINGAECEPYLNCDNRLMIERPADLIKGTLIIKEALKLSHVIIGVEVNKPLAIKSIENELNKINDKSITVCKLPCIYPQGGEKQLILSATKRVVPEGKLPSEVGVIVHNVSTAIAIYEAVTLHKPLFERVVTVSGGVSAPKNILAPLGLPISKLIEFAGGTTGEISKAILGGPMTGFAVHSLNIPVYKGMNGVIVYTEAHPELKRKETSACIRCGRCLRACPMNLSPVMLEKFAQHKKYEELSQWKLLSCIECSACNYVCPANRPLKNLFRLEKKRVIAYNKEVQSVKA